MSPLTVFFRTLARSSAICIGATVIFLHPSLEWRGGSRAIVGALQAPHQGAVEGLIAALQDADAAVRATAAHALGRMGDQSAIDPLIAAVGDEEARVRRAAAEALGELQASKGLDALTRALKDDDVGVRRAAASAIAEIGADGAAAAGAHPHPHPHPHPVAGGSGGVRP